MGVDAAATRKVVIEVEVTEGVDTVLFNRLVKKEARRMVRIIDEWEADRGRAVIEEVLPRLLTLHSTTGIPRDIREKAGRLVADVDPYDLPFVALAGFLGVPQWCKSYILRFERIIYLSIWSLLYGYFVEA